MFERLKSWYAKHTAMEPPPEYLFDGKVLSVSGPTVQAQTLRIEDVREVGVETFDGGPLVEDVYWVFNRGPDSFYVPQGSPVFNQLFTWVETLDGFDGEAFIAAMGCADCHYFLCWQR